MKKFKIFLSLILIIIIIGVSGLFFTKNKEEIYINIVLSQKSYSYLPNEAKEYIKEIYKETGEVILTEKNKKENKLYLNPQYVKYLTLSEKEKDNEGEIPISMVIDYNVKNISKSINVPSSYDLRNDNENNYVTPVRDQGDLGICWTFATAGAAESHLLKTTNNSYDSSSKLISERQIDYATSRNGIKDYKSEYVSFINRSLGDGGNFYISTIALANGVSLIDYNSFKEYNDRDLQKMELSDVLSYNKSLYELNSTINFPRLSLRDSTSILTEEEKETRESYLQEVKQNIMKNGAAYVSTYMDKSCRYQDSNLNNTVIDVYNCNSSGGHAMEIIGWDDNLEYSYCADTNNHNSDVSDCERIVSGKGVWILKNSWGDTLQYPYLTYDSLYTSVSFIDEMEDSQNKNWDNNYILGDGSEDITLKVYKLKDTKIKNNEVIKKIKFITDNYETKYNVKIKKKDGTYKTYSKTNSMPGLMTIDITDDILVDKDTEITIYSEDYFIDRVSIFTSNINTDPLLDLSKYDNMTLSDYQMRLYSETKNILSGDTVDYKLYNSNNQDVSNKINYTNNVVVENNINTLVSFSNDLDSGTYRIDAIYNSTVVGSMNIKVIKMEGLGTKNNPYIITNSTQLYKIRDNLDAYYELGNDIDLTEDTREGGKYSLESNTCPQGFGWESINGFSGSLDGKGHTIKGLYQNNYLTCNDDMDKWFEWNNNGNGLFGTTQKNVTIKNLVLEDFDITCQGANCSILAAKYIGSMDENGNTNYSDKNEYTATFENIAIINSKIQGAYNSRNNGFTYGGGILSYVESIYGNINISNIYLDINMYNKNIMESSYLAHILQGNEVNIQNIRLQGDIKGKYNDGSGDAILIYQLVGNTPVSIKNVVSTVTATNVMGNLMGNVYNSNLSLDGVNVLNNENKPLCRNNSCSNTSNINIFDKDTELVEFTKNENYSSWQEFNNNWNMEIVDGIPRIPVLKFMNFDYTSIPNITINQVLNKKNSIYDYLTPKIDAAKRISYRSNNEEIVTMGDDGTIIPQSTGNTTIHVESLYDGYIKDVPINVTYVPHYTINFDANGGTGSMDSVEVGVGKKINLPKNEFTKEYYELKEWNTKADGTGTAYADLAEIPAMNDKESITLYAIWWGEERVVTFDANGGTVNPDRKIVRIKQNYGDLPIPVREGYGFDGWDDLKESIYIDAFTELYGTELTARWIPDAYTIIYDANGGTVKEEYKNKYAVYLHSETIATTYGKNGQDKDVYDYLYEREGYTFKEWNTKPDGTGTSYSDEQKINRSSNITLYAIWENGTGTITYNSNYDDNQIKKQEFTFNTDTKLDENTFERQGYKFTEWNTKPDGTGTSYSDGQVINKKENITLYAQWEENNHTIIFKSNDGKNNETSQVMLDSVSTKLNKNTFIRVGYEFKGWNTKPDGTGTSYEDEKNIAINTDLTLYAQWQRKPADVSYTTHVQNIGWQSYVSNGQMAGTSGRSLRLEGIKIKLANQDYSGNIEYRTHIQNIGWEKEYKKNDEMSGTSGRSLRLEGIEIKLTGEIANHYDVYYRVHAQNFGWLGWARNGEQSGTSGYSYRLEGIEIKLIEKGTIFNEYGEKYTFVDKTKGKITPIGDTKKILYTTHVQNVGWQDYVADGAMAGTSGRSLRLEGIKIKLANQDYSGNIEYKTHIQNIGWEKEYKKNDEMSGTSGRSLRLEAIQIRLTGEMANHYDVYYRVHAQNFGWLDWAKNDDPAGTAGYAYRLEGIEVVLVEKDRPSPGSTTRAFVQK